MMRTSNSSLIIVLYVDDLLKTGSSTTSIATIKSTLHEIFSIKDVGLLHFFLGLEISQTESGIKVS